MRYHVSCNCSCSLDNKFQNVRFVINIFYSKLYIVILKIHDEFLMQSIENTAKASVCQNAAEYFGAIGIDMAIFTWYNHRVTWLRYFQQNIFICIPIACHRFIFTHRMSTYILKDCMFFMFSQKCNSAFLCLIDIADSNRFVWGKT